MPEKTMDERMSQLEATIYGNGDPAKSVLMRLISLERYAKRLANWGRIAGVAVIGLFLASIWELIAK